MQGICLLCYFLWVLKTANLTLMFFLGRYNAFYSSNLSSAHGGRVNDIQHTESLPACILTHEEASYRCQAAAGNYQPNSIYDSLPVSVWFLAYYSITEPTLTFLIMVTPWVFSVGETFMAEPDFRQELYLCKWKSLTAKIIGVLFFK